MSNNNGGRVEASYNYKPARLELSSRVFYLDTVILTKRTGHNLLLKRQAPSDTYMRCMKYTG